MWKKLLGTTLIAAFALSSCTDKDVYQGPKEDEKEFNTFPFSTVQKDVNLNVNYVNGAVQSNVYFEVYDEMPVVGIYLFSRFLCTNLDGGKCCGWKYRSNR